MSSTPPDTFKGWVAHDATSPLTFTTFHPKPFTETDIEVAVSHCGICGTDIHTLRSGWGPSDYPCVVGHEIIGTVTRIGAGVPMLPSSPASREIRIGDRVGIGAQSMSCLKADCADCADGRENYCPRITGTYNSRYADKSKAYGGFAMRWRGPAHFAFKIPDSLPSAEAAPLLCGGVTMFAPLRKYGAGPGKSVGIVGIGGLGHLGILFARALGCDRVVGISRTSSKRKDAIEGLGADAFIATDEEKKWGRTYSRSLDLIICTVDAPDMPLSQYLRLLKVDGTFVQVGAPDKPLPQLTAFSLIQKGVKVTGSNIGSPEDIRLMLQLAAEKRVLPWIQKRPMGDVNSALADMDAGKARRVCRIHRTSGDMDDQDLRCRRSG
ncbi:chaperonin 10-like protein [Aspergillus bertholletiae]|uniref:alcohol dehydrogenase (NADP(+)) n=1 Tax=Aspergillus bertholletiae TaxID=1226010 RepID=A0A5N7B5S1_9EURO|nr:chaperonin 10-like protein [Aspergillus bertholletiae]